MPGWHERTKPLEEQGKVRVLGIVQEQHPDRTRLFMQWKEMGFPILVDSLNLLDVAVVPVTLLIDEAGTVRVIQPKGEALADFLMAESVSAPAPARVGAGKALQPPESLRKRGDELYLWGGDEALDDAIKAYRSALELEPGHGRTHFRLGTAYRRRYDSRARRANDFARAVEHWGRALDVDPNQYIWRRRIQQYGPRLEKPYPFYDWVDRARREIEERGQVPAPLPVEPSGAEFASPSRSFAAAAPTTSEPDPRGRIRRDLEELIEVETIVVPSSPQAGKAARIHVVFRPDLSRKAHWNNEVEDLLFWVDPPPGWLVDQRLIRVRRPPQEVSVEERKVEFEVKVPSGYRGAIKMPAYALYYICEDVDGLCLYRRRDVDLELEVGPTKE